jgi:DNA-binding response OmpR family regulator
VTILLVDSADSDGALLASALRVEGFDVLIVATAAEARQAVATHSVVLAIVDLMNRNDGANGLDLARDLRAANPAMRVFLTSSYHLSERQLERADCGVSGFIPKPYDLREVVEFIRAKVSGPPSGSFSSERRSGLTPRPTADVSVSRRGRG